MSGTNWNDPELKQLRDEFLGSLAERRARLVRALDSNSYPPALEVAHKLAGAAGSFGFPILSEGAAALEDCLTPPSGTDSRDFTVFVKAVIRAIESVARDKADCETIRQDKDWKRLISAAEALASESSS